MGRRLILSGLGWLSKLDDPQISDRLQGNRLRWSYIPNVMNGRKVLSEVEFPSRYVLERADDSDILTENSKEGKAPLSFWEEGDTSFRIKRTGIKTVFSTAKRVHCLYFSYIGAGCKMLVRNGTELIHRRILPKVTDPEGFEIRLENSGMDRIEFITQKPVKIQKVKSLSLSDVNESGLRFKEVATIEGGVGSLEWSECIAKRLPEYSRITSARWNDLQQLWKSMFSEDDYKKALQTYHFIGGAAAAAWELAVAMGSGFLDGPYTLMNQVDNIADTLDSPNHSRAYTAYRVTAFFRGGYKLKSNICFLENGGVRCLLPPEFNGFQQGKCFTQVDDLKEELRSSYSFKVSQVNQCSRRIEAKVSGVQKSIPASSIPTFPFDRPDRLDVSSVLNRSALEKDFEHEIEFSCTGLEDYHSSMNLVKIFKPDSHRVIARKIQLRATDSWGRKSEWRRPAWIGTQELPFRYKPVAPQPQEARLSDGKVKIRFAEWEENGITKRWAPDWFVKKNLNRFKLKVFTKTKTEESRLIEITEIKKLSSRTLRVRFTCSESTDIEEFRDGMLISGTSRFSLKEIRQGIITVELEPDGNSSVRLPVRGPARILQPASAENCWLAVPGASFPLAEAFNRINTGESIVVPFDGDVCSEAVMHQYRVRIYMSGVTSALSNPVFFTQWPPVPEKPADPVITMLGKDFFGRTLVSAALEAGQKSPDRYTLHHKTGEVEVSGLCGAVKPDRIIQNGKDTDTFADIISLNDENQPSFIIRGVNKAGEVSEETVYDPD